MLSQLLGVATKQLEGIWALEAITHSLSKGDRGGKPIDNNSQLRQRLKALLRMVLDVFLRDPDITERYNRASARSWKANEWQQMPTLRDFVRYCTRERLNLNLVQVELRAIFFKEKALICPFWAWSAYTSLEKQLAYPQKTL